MRRSGALFSGATIIRSAIIRAKAAVKAECAKLVNGVPGSARGAALGGTAV